VPTELLEVLGQHREATVPQEVIQPTIVPGPEPIDRGHPQGQLHLEPLLTAETTVAPEVEEVTVPDAAAALEVVAIEVLEAAAEVAEVTEALVVAPEAVEA